MRKNRLYLLLPIRSLMFIAVFIIISLMSGEKLENLFHWWSVLGMGRWKNKSVDSKYYKYFSYRNSFIFMQKTKNNIWEINSI